MVIQIINLKYSCLDIRRNAINLPDCYDFDGKIYKNCHICPYNKSNEIYIRIKNNAFKNESTKINQFHNSS